MFHVPVLNVLLRAKLKLCPLIFKESCKNEEKEKFISIETDD